MSGEFAQPGASCLSQGIHKTLNENKTRCQVQKSIANTKAAAHLKATAGWVSETRKHDAVPCIQRVDLPTPPVSSLDALQLKFLYCHRIRGFS